MNKLKEKSKSKESWFGRLVTFILIITFTFMIVIAISSKSPDGARQIFGYELKTVLSGSMEPEIKTGSIIVVKTNEDMKNIQNNDVITFLQEKDPGEEGVIVVTHRVTEVIESGNEVLYRTKGDSNNGEDINPVHSENVIAVYTGFTVPYIGYFINFAQSKQGNIYLLILPGFLILVYSIITIWRTIDGIEVVEEPIK